MQFIDDSIFTVGLSLEPITDFRVLQHSCLEARIFIDYLEKWILSTDQKWRRRLEHDAQDFFMKDNKLWGRERLPPTVDW